MSPLSVYKASAGSGKTYRLTLAYLELLFKNPFSYRHILAVTFTNKAASEMKSRILERLYSLSILEEGQNSDDLQTLMAGTNLDAETLIKRAGELLQRILNEYSRFSVGTIDRFFQGIIRAFAREIGLPANFILELDRERIISEAADRLFMDIGEDEELRKWLLKLAEVRIESSRNWNFRAEVINLGQELFAEDYQEIMLRKENTISREKILVFIGKTTAMKKESIHSIRELSELSLAEMDAAGYTVNDFLRNEKGLTGVFMKGLKEEEFSLTDTQKAGMTDVSKWISKNESDQSKYSFVENTFMVNLRSIYEELVLLTSINEINRYIYALGILGDLSEKILDLTDEKNLFLLSDASRFLRGLIGDNPTPFIYERTGNAIDHIMLDEFQDTSVFQWENFKPLIEHTLASGNQNIIVGDVKQSIYRWRNSDWKILADHVSKAFPGFDLEMLSLQDNWRSQENVIRFNNLLFAEAPQIIRAVIESQMEQAAVSKEFREQWNSLLLTAYEDVQQHVPEKSKGNVGYVRGDIIADDDALSFKEQALERLPGWIMELQDQGYAPGDIAILVRTNREGSEVARILMEESRKGGESYDFSFISNDSLFIGNNTVIRLLICMLKYIVDEHDELNILNLKYFLYVFSKGVSFSLSEVLHPDFKVDVILGDALISLLPVLRRMALYELIERLIQELGLDARNSDIPYIQAFQEIVMDVQQKDPGSLHDFLEYWKEFGVKKTITVSDDQDSIRIITIHKAKGLQFRTVLIPFCDWGLTTSAMGEKDTILWCGTEGTKFQDLPVVPVKFRKNLLETVFAPRYMEELIMGYVDNLNLLYVALTRAEEQMIIGIPEQTASALSKAGHLLVHSLERYANKDSTGFVRLTETEFQVGEPGSAASMSKGLQEDFVFGRYPVRFREENIRIRMKSTELLSDYENEEEHLRFGQIMHDIFASIKSKDDIEGAVRQYVNEGLISQADSQKLEKIIGDKVSARDISHFFSGEFKVINEREIFSDGKAYRPDRVMLGTDETLIVDYKFGDLEEGKYQKQVLKYMHLLKAMNYPGVKGFLWYVMSDKLVEVGRDGI